MLPGFHPQWTARKGAQELYEAYRSAGLAAADIQNGRYFRINEIRRLQQVGSLDTDLRWTGRFAETTVSV